MTSSKKTAEAILAKSIKKTSTPCWYDILPSEARKTVDETVILMKERPDVSITAVARTLKEEFNIPRSINAIMHKLGSMIKDEE